MSVSVTLTCQEILSGRLCGLLIASPDNASLSGAGRLGI